MSLHEYQRAVELVKADEPFYSLIMAAMLRADTPNASKLVVMFPVTAKELERRYNSSGGMLPGDDEPASSTTPEEPGPEHTP